MRFSPASNRFANESASKKRNLSEHLDFSGTSMHGSQFMNRTEDGWVPDSPVQFVDTKYQLSSRIDAASLGFTRMDENVYGQTGYRRSLGDINNVNMISSRNTLLDSLERSSRVSDGHMCDDDFRGRKNGESNANNHRERWSRFAIQAVNAVAGKAWEFCKNSAAVFRGFHAGGGTKYKVKNPEDSKLDFEAVEPAYRLKRSSSAHEDSNPHNYMNNSSVELSPSRPLKRRQVCANPNDPLERNWVVVSPTAATPAKARIMPTRCSIPVSSSARRMPNNNNNSSYISWSQSCSGFSPSPRKPALQLQHARSSHAGPPGLSPSQRASFASPRSPASLIPRPVTPNVSPLQKRKSGLIPDSPLAVEAKREAQRWAASLKKDERQQDESIRRLDSRLKAMIREGKEALSTKVEVYGEDNEVSRNKSAKARRWRY